MPFDPQFDDFVSADTARATFVPHGTFRDPGFHLLWGDGVRVMAVDGGQTQVRARGRTGWIDSDALGGQSLLEFYFIDVGQGDGMLIKTPDFHHIMLDGGYPREAQPTGKSAADFVDWKFAKDYGTDTIVLDAMIASHIDYDHYGGLDDILDVAQLSELDCSAITVEAFYHSGLAHWAAFGGVPKGFGPFSPTARNAVPKWFTRLLGDRASCVDATSNVGAQLRGEWGGFIRNVLLARRADGTPTPIARLSQATGWLPGFAPGSPVAIRVLGPIEGVEQGGPALLRLGSDPSQNTNGTSVLLRVDFDRSRTLLTGDLNQAAHHALLEHYAGEEREFAVDVAKCCHHGSEDVSYAFLNFVKAACTVISSGDSEGHDHPRPRVVAASGLSGYATFKDDRVLTPLVYSTELARSVMVATPTALDATAAGGVLHGPAALPAIDVSYRFTPPGALNASKGKKALGRAKVMHRLVYGLVNVRTDGRRIVAATMEEGDQSFTVKEFPSRF